MSASTKLVLGAVLSALVLYCLSGPAQVTGVDDLSRAVHRQNLDSYWLDQTMWTEHGYRPHAHAQTTRFTNLPSYLAGKNYYASGITLPTPSLKNPLDKSSIQLNANGTWH